MKRGLALLLIISLLLTAPSCFRKSVKTVESSSHPAESSQADVASGSSSISEESSQTTSEVVSTPPAASKAPPSTPPPPPPPPAPEPEAHFEMAFYNLEQAYTRRVTEIARSKEYSNAVSRHCYNALSAEDKTIYNKIHEAALRLQIQINDLPPKNQADKYYYVLEAYLFDNPDVFWLKPWIYYGINNLPSGPNYFVQLYYDLDFDFQGDMFSFPDQHVKLVDRAAEEIKQKSAQLSAVLEESIAVFTPEDGVYERERKLHDWLVSRVTYDYAALTDRDSRPRCDDAYGALIVRTTVCVGYTHAMSLLLRNAGIDCIAVGGYADGGSHMWNLVKLDDSWYHVDATWNDWEKDGKQYIGRIYFNAADMDMFFDHSYHEYYVYDPPVCYMSTYDFFIYEELYFAQTGIDSIQQLKQAILRAEKEGWAIIPIKLGNSISKEEYFGILHAAVFAANQSLTQKINYDKSLYYDYYDPWRVLYCFFVYFP